MGSSRNNSKWLYFECQSKQQYFLHSIKVWRTIRNTTELWKDSSPWSLLHRSIVASWRRMDWIFRGSGAAERNIHVDYYTNSSSSSSSSSVRMEQEYPMLHFVRNKMSTKQRKEFLWNRKNICITYGSFNQSVVDWSIPPKNDIRWVFMSRQRRTDWL